MSKKKESDPRGDLGNVIDADDALVTRERKPGMKKRKKEESRVKEAVSFAALFLPDLSWHTLDLSFSNPAQLQQLASAHPFRSPSAGFHAR